MGSKMPGTNCKFLSISENCFGESAFSLAKLEGQQSTHFDRILAIGLPGIFGALNVNAVRGNSMFSGLAFTSCGLIARGPATMPSPVSTRAWPLEPALEPSSGISFLAWKFRGLRPRTTMGAVAASVSTTLEPFANVPITFRCTTKCCCSSFLLPLLAVALRGIILAHVLNRSSPRTLPTYIRNCRRRHPIGYTA